MKEFFGACACRRCRDIRGSRYSRASHWRREAKPFGIGEIGSQSIDVVNQLDRLLLSPQTTVVTLHPSPFTRSSCEGLLPDKDQYIFGGKVCERKRLWVRFTAAASLRLRSDVGFS